MAARVQDPLIAALSQHFRNRLEGMRMDRLSFWSHWGQCAEMLLPRRYRWFVTANQYNRGNPVNQSILDETGLLAARVCSSGMMAGLTNPSRVWYKLGPHDLAYLDYGPVKRWYAEVERRMARVLAESNFYQALATLYHDNSVFGSASMIIYEDDEEVIRCYNPMLGEFFFGSGARFSIDSTYREFVLTTLQAVEMFGYENVGDSLQQDFRAGGSALTKEVIIQHGIEPNFPLYDGNQRPISYPVPKHFNYRECYWQLGGNSSYDLLRVKGFHEKPFVGARWDVNGNEAYGRSPGMDALPATRQLQVQQRRKGQAIDKIVNPPMVGSVSMKNEPSSILPGAMNYVADLQGSGFKPAFQVDPRIQEMVEDIQETQGRIKAIFFNDLFLMISSLDTVRTATEIDARREEKLIQLGPVIERFQNEVLDPIIERVFAIMARRGLIPPAPPEIQGHPIQVTYISMLAEAQRAAATALLERLAAFAGNLAGADPEVMDNLNLDAMIDVYADGLGVDPKVIRSMQEILVIRKARADAQQQQALLQQTTAAVQGAQTLSKTDVGGGRNALQLVTQ